MPADIGLNDLPEIHQFLDGFYLSRIGIRILIGQHIALHEKQRTDHIGAPPTLTLQDSVRQERQTRFCRLPLAFESFISDQAGFVKVQ